ncbi:WbqC family protein [Aridibaculum aurantiacum]|uniref:WbqC family protein n=1 Tax=Aridibaculum aurantiacum TaxID=2810307 RepID=UPI001A96F7F3|nr:WbqC family protein [Aridibaculum aurantiacum]
MKDQKDLTHVLSENQYFPRVDYFIASAGATCIILEQYESFQKMSYRNRCTIFGSNGPIDLSIPLVRGREQRKLITQVEIDNSTDWRTRHLRSIQSSYAKAPFFEYYFDAIEGLIRNPTSKLFEFNLQVLKWLVKVLKLNCTIELSTTYEHEPTDVLDLRNKFLPRNRLASSERSLEYYQVFQDRFGFQPNLSIIDLLFNEGPAATRLLQSPK